MLKKIGLVALVAILALLGFAATRPDSFRVQRSVSVHAPPDKLYPLVDDFHAWAGWSPWEKLDPAMKRTYGGEARGKGATYEWEGNDAVGTGRMEITDASAPSKVVVALTFLKPFEAHNIAELTIEPRGDATEVTWAMYGPSPFVSKLMSVFLDMDSLVGKDFEAGLASLKALAEK